MKYKILSHEIKEFESWEDWLSKTENFLKEKRYKKYIQDISGEDFSYSRNIDDKFLSIFLFYDFTRYNSLGKFSVQYLCMAMPLDSTFKMEIGGNFDLIEYEKMGSMFCDKFKHLMK